MDGDLLSTEISAIQLVDIPVPAILCGRGFRAEFSERL